MKRIRLTESDLHRIVKETIMSVLNENKKPEIYDSPYIDYRAIEAEIHKDYKDHNEKDAKRNLERWHRDYKPTFWNKEKVKKVANDLSKKVAQLKGK